MEWIRDEQGNPKLALAAAKVIGSLIRDPRFINRSTVCREIMNTEEGCFKQFFQLALSGPIDIHNNIKITDITIGEKINSGALTSVYRVWVLSNLCLR